MTPKNVLVFQTYAVAEACQRAARNVQGCEVKINIDGEFEILKDAEHHNFSGSCIFDRSPAQYRGTLVPTEEELAVEHFYCVPHKPVFWVKVFNGQEWVQVQVTTTARSTFICEFVGVDFTAGRA